MKKFELYRVTKDQNHIITITLFIKRLGHLFQRFCITLFIFPVVHE